MHRQERTPGGKNESGIQMTCAGVYAVAVGVLMIGQWVFLLATKQVHELKTEPARITFHLGAEFLTVVALIGGGLGVLTKGRWGRQVFPVAVGMLLYTLIASPGYFAQRHAWLLLFMLAVLFLLALVRLGLFIQAA
jgi:hypothetical protein